MVIPLSKGFPTRSFADPPEQERTFPTRRETESSSRDSGRLGEGLAVLGECENDVGGTPRALFPAGGRADAERFPEPAREHPALRIPVRSGKSPARTSRSRDRSAAKEGRGFYPRCWGSPDEDPGRLAPLAPRKYRQIRNVALTPSLSSGRCGGSPSSVWERSLMTRGEQELPAGPGKGLTDRAAGRNEPMCSL